jgi:hypothetical protein
MAAHNTVALLTKTPTTGRGWSLTVGAACAVALLVCPMPSTDTASAACRTSSGAPTPYAHTVTSSGYKLAETSTNAVCSDKNGWYTSKFRKTDSASFCTAVLFQATGGGHMSNKQCNASTAWTSGPTFFEADREASVFACAWGKYDEFPICPDGPYLNLGF